MKNRNLVANAYRWINTHRLSLHVLLDSELMPTAPLLATALIKEVSRISERALVGTEGIKADELTVSACQLSFSHTGNFAAKRGYIPWGLAQLQFRSAEYPEREFYVVLWINVDTWIAPVYEHMVLEPKSDARFRDCLGAAALCLGASFYMHPHPRRVRIPIVNYERLHSLWSPLVSSVYRSLGDDKACEVGLCKEMLLPEYLKALSDEITRCRICTPALARIASANSRRELRSLLRTTKIRDQSLAHVYLYSRLRSRLLGKGDKKMSKWAWEIVRVDDLEVVSGRSCIDTNCGNVRVARSGSPAFMVSTNGSRIHANRSGLLRLLWYFQSSTLRARISGSRGILRHIRETCGSTLDKLVEIGDLHPLTSLQPLEYFPGSFFNVWHVDFSDLDLLCKETLQIVELYARALETLELQFNYNSGRLENEIEIYLSQ